MTYLPWRIRPPTDDERNVLFWIIVVILLGFGPVCLFFGCRAAAGRAREAAGLIRGGYGFIVFGVVVWAVRRFFSGDSE